MKDVANRNMKLIKMEYMELKTKLQVWILKRPFPEAFRFEKKRSEKCETVMKMEQLCVK